jgi:hypothetical protein
MPTACEPCPGNSNAMFIANDVTSYRCYEIRGKTKSAAGNDSRFLISENALETELQLQVNAAVGCAATTRTETATTQTIRNAE